MSLGIASGFALLALVSGFFITSVKKPISVDLGKKDVFENIFDDSNVSSSDSYVSSGGLLTNQSITSYPFSEVNPDYTGASYVGGDWFLMANGLYFNRTSKKWSKEPPEEEKKESSGFPVGSVVDSAVSAGASVVKARSAVIIAIASVLGAYLLSKINNKE